MLIKMAHFSLILAIFLSLSCTKKLVHLTKDLREHNVRLAPTLSLGALKNGLAFYHMPVSPEEKSCSLRLNIKGGSLLEGGDELGMAHLIQHLALEERAFVNDISLKEWFTKNGMPYGPDVNASSSIDHTVYKIDLSNCTTEKIKESLSIFRYFADGLSFTNEALAKEINNINEEEYYGKNSNKKLNEQINKALYPGALFINRPTLGTKNTREQINISNLKQFFQKSHDPKNLTVVIIGNTDQRPLLMIESAFLDLKSHSETAIYDSGTLRHKNPSFIVHHPNMKQVEVNFVIQPQKIIKPNFSYDLLKERLSYNLALNMLRNSLAEHDNMHKSVFRETTLSGSMLDNNTYELNLSISASQENYENNFIQSLALIRNAAEKGFNENDFNVFRMALIHSLDHDAAQQAAWKPALWAELITEHINNDKFAYSASDYRDRAVPILQELTPKDCQSALASALKSGNKLIYSVGAIPNNQENILALQKLLRPTKIESPSKKFDFAYKASSCELSPPPLEYIQNIDAFRTKITDNLQVLMKATKFNDDEVLISIFNDEGPSTMSSEEYAQARMAQAIWLEGGLVKHPPEEVTRLYNGRISSFRLNILPARLQTTLVTRKEHVRFALEIINAYLYDPLYADHVLALAKDKTKLSYRRSKRDIWAPLHHDFPRSLSGDDHRVGYSKLEDLLDVQREDLLAWHHKFLASRKLNMVVVGDFNPEELGHEISCVTKPAQINIPTGARSKKPSLLSFKSGVNKVYNINSKNQPSKVVIRYPMNYPELAYTDHRGAILQKIIEEHFHEQKPFKITPDVKATISANSFAKNYMDIIFSVPKNLVAEVLNKTKKSLEDLAMHGVSNNTLNRVKQKYLNQIDKNPQENLYWLLSLSENFNNIDKLEPTEKIVQSIETLNTKEINNNLNKYFRSSLASSAIVNIK